MTLLSGNICLDAVGIIVTLLTIIVGFFRWSFTFWKTKGVYTLPASIPFGNAANLLLQKESLATEFKNNYDEFKKKGLRYGGFYFFTKPVFIPVDLDLIKAIMTKDFAHFTNRIFYTNSEREPLTGHIIFLKGLKWKLLRHKLKPCYSPAKIKMMFQTLLDCTQELVVITDNAAKKGEAMDVKEVISRFLIDVVGSCAFGIECNSLRNPDAEFLKYGNKFFDISLWDSFVRLLSMMTPEILNYVKFRTIRKDIADFFMNVVRETVNYREENGIVRNDLLQMLIQLKNNEKMDDADMQEINEVSSIADGFKTSTDAQKTSFTLEELTAQCFAFFMAGYETSTTTTTFCLFELAKNTEIQHKLRKEISAVLTRHGGKITYDSLMEMTYMDKCISETLRMYPPIPILTRECTQTYQVPDSDIVIEKGTFVFIPIFGIQRDPDLYTDPEKFDPERYSEEAKACRHPFSWIPFGDGPRICIASKLGIVQVKVGLTALLKGHKFTLNPKTASPLSMDPKKSFVLTSEGNIWLDVEKVV